MQNLRRSGTLKDIWDKNLSHISKLSSEAASDIWGILDYN